MNMSISKLRSQLTSNQKNLQGVTDKSYTRIASEMRTDETLLKLCIGYDQGNTYIACTDRRIIKISLGVFMGRNTEDIMYENVVSVEQKKGFATSEITIHSKSNSIKTDTVNNDMAREFVEWLRNKISTPIMPVINNDSNDIISKLERLATLKEKGILSDEEFLSEKRRLLDN